MNNLQMHILQRRLEKVLFAFFVLVALSLVIVYAVDPAIYVQVLSLQPGNTSHPLLVTLFFVGILAFIGVLIVGVRRHWRWLFWLILVAFGAGFLDIPVTLLQLLGILPQLFPTWYSLYRMSIACLQVVIAVWMGRIAYHHGVWAMGRKTLSKRSAGSLDRSGV